MTLCKGFREVREHVPSGKMRNFRPSNCCKCIEMVSPTTTTLNFLRSHQADLFGSWGEEVRAHPAHLPPPPPPAYGLDMYGMCVYIYGIV